MAGSKSATKIPMMAITTNSSTNVKALRLVSFTRWGELISPLPAILFLELHGFDKCRNHHLRLNKFSAPAATTVRNNEAGSGTPLPLPSPLPAPGPPLPKFVRHVLYWAVPIVPPVGSFGSVLVVPWFFRH